MANKFYSPFFGFLFLLVSGAAPAQNIGIGIVNPNTSAQLDVSSTSRGLLIPRMTTSGISAITSPAKGLLVYDSTKNQLMVNMGTSLAPNWQSAVTGSGWSLSGNSGTDPSTQFIGSTDSKPVSFRVNNITAGKMDVAGNVFWGLRAGQANSAGYSNIAIGTDALRTSNTYGAIAIGDSALQNSTGWNNLAIGYNAMMSNTTGGGNMAIGAWSLRDNTTGGSNLAIGGNTLPENTTGAFNCVVGFGAMPRNTIGSNNTSFGHYSLYTNTSGTWNTAIGYQALDKNNGNYNTGVGVETLFNTTLSQFNTALGYGAGADHDLGYNNVFLGANTGTTGDGFYNCIAIGQDVYCTTSNQVRIGNPATAIIGGYVGWSTFSDGRVKKDISENVKGLDFILKLRPVTYRWDMAALDRRKSSQGLAKTAAARSNPSDNESRRFSGFIAQEVEKASQESGYDFGGVEKPKNDNDLYTLRYADFVVPLVKAMQELNAKVERLEKENALLQQRITSLETKK
jgi:hypothetical protein